MSGDTQYSGTCEIMFKIYNFTKNIEPKDFSVAPYDLNYDVLGFHKKRTFNKGEIKTVEYYGSYDFTGQTYTDLIVKETRTYYRINQMLNRRHLYIEWYLCDGTVGAIKETWKYYTPEESMAAGERRRRNVISTLKIETIGLIMQASGLTQSHAEQVGWEFLKEFNYEIDQYVEGVQDLLKNAIMTTQNHGWLDWEIPNTGGITVRMYLYDSINIDYTENNIDVNF